MYYKVEITKTGVEIISVVKRARNDKQYLYLTQEELDQLNPNAIKNYNVVKKIIRKGSNEK